MPSDMTYFVILNRSDMVRLLEDVIPLPTSIRITFLPYVSSPEVGNHYACRMFNKLDYIFEIDCYIYYFVVGYLIPLKV